MAQQANLQVATRAGTGKGAARSLRREGKVPGVIYGHGRAAEPVVLLPQASGALVTRAGDDVALDAHELSVAQWAMEHGQPAGLGTDTLHQSRIKRGIETLGRAQAIGDALDQRRGFVRNVVPVISHGKHPLACRAAHHRPVSPAS